MARSHAWLASFPLLAAVLATGCSGSGGTTGGTSAGTSSGTVTGTTSGTASGTTSGASGTTSGSLPKPDAGDLLVADQWNNRIVEINPVTNQVVWSFGDGNVTPGPTSIVAPNDVERIEDNLTLIAATGSPPPPSPPAVPACTDAVNGCPDNRILIIDMTGHIVWQYGQAGIAGSDANELNVPVFAARLPSKNVLVTDQANNRIIEIQPAADAGGTIVWDYGEAVLNGPNSAERLTNGNTLIADQGNNRIIEVDGGQNIVWQFPPTTGATDAQMLDVAAFASRLPNGNTLIVDANNSRVIEVDTSSNIVWSYSTLTEPGSVQGTSQPTRAVRLADGNTLIADQANNAVVEVNDAGTVVYQYGTVGPLGGAGPGQLNWPYDAKVVGDFTGLSSPPAN